MLHTHTQLTHTHNLLTHNLSTHTSCPHTTYPHTTCHHTTYPRNNSLTQNLPGVALRDIDLHFAWQAWHLSYWAGSGGALGLGLAPWSAAVCMAGVALRDIDLHFAWQAWHLATWTCILRGRRGTYRTGLLPVARLAGFGAVVAAAVCVAGVALRDIDLHFAWQAWHLATWTCILRGRRGTHRTGLAPVARLGWVWRRGPPPSAWQAWHFAT